MLSLQTPIDCGAVEPAKQAASQGLDLKSPLLIARKEEKEDKNVPARTATFL